MLSAMQTALGGIMRNQHGLQVAANNIANVNTQGYRTQRPDPNTGQAPPAVDPPDRPEGHPDNDVDLATEIVHLKTHELGIKANAKVVSLADELLGELIDALA